MKLKMMMNPSAFLHWTQKEFAQKNAELGSDIEESTIIDVQPREPLEIEFVIPSGLQTDTADTAVEDEEVHMVVPPEVAQFLRKGGYKIVLQPIDDSNAAEIDTVGADT